MNKNGWVYEWNSFGEHVYLRSLVFEALTAPSHIGDPNEPAIK